jgi:hypothetical protein
VGEDDEDILACFSTADRVDERLNDVGVVHIEVATEDAPKDSLEGGDADSVDGTSDESVWDRLVDGMGRRDEPLTQGRTGRWQSNIGSPGHRAATKEPSCHQTTV